MTDYIQIGLLTLVVLLLLVPKQKAANGMGGKRGRAVILDTSGLIDGRILGLARSGFIPSKLIIPQVILRELQLLADGKDSQKRGRARFGLDVVRELQTLKNVSVVIDRTPTIKAPTDDQLVLLAKKLSAELYTTDFNLNKVANVEGIRVLNVNEVARDLRPTALPGEVLSVKIVQRGSNRDQGVGYLDDGTMIVVDKASKHINKTVKVEVDRVHQTEAGKMVFAHLIS